MELNNLGRVASRRSTIIAIAPKSLSDSMIQRPMYDKSPTWEVSAGLGLGAIGKRVGGDYPPEIHWLTGDSPLHSAPEMHSRKDRLSAPCNRGST